MMFYVSDGWHFSRGEDGAVEFGNESRFIETLVIDAGSWASIVASVSRDGDTAEQFSKAQALHGATGGEDGQV